jgi:hypothetical protein
VLAEAGLEGELHTHVDPCQRAFCAQCAVRDCPVRRLPQTTDAKTSVEEAVSPGLM